MGQANLALRHQAQEQEEHLNKCINASWWRAGGLVGMLRSAWPVQALHWSGERRVHHGGRPPPLRGSAAPPYPALAPAHNNPQCAVRRGEQRGGVG